MNQDGAKLASMLANVKVQARSNVAVPVMGGFGGGLLLISSSDEEYSDEDDYTSDYEDSDNDSDHNTSDDDDDAPALQLNLPFRPQQQPQDPAPPPQFGIGKAPPRAVPPHPPLNIPSQPSSRLETNPTTTSRPASRLTRDMSPPRAIITMSMSPPRSKTHHNPKTSLPPAAQLANPGSKLTLPPHAMPRRQGMGGKRSGSRPGPRPTPKIPFPPRPRGPHHLHLLTMPCLVVANPMVVMVRAVSVVIIMMMAQQGIIIITIMDQNPRASWA